MNGGKWWNGEKNKKKFALMPVRAQHFFITQAINDIFFCLCFVITPQYQRKCKRIFAKRHIATGKELKSKRYTKKRWKTRRKECVWCFGISWWRKGSGIFHFNLFHHSALSYSPNWHYNFYYGFKEVLFFCFTPLLITLIILCVAQEWIAFFYRPNHS